MPLKIVRNDITKMQVEAIVNTANQREEEKLRSCYQKSLQLAKEYHIKSIAFPLISTGGFGYPKEEGMRIALDEINAFLLKNDMLIYLVVFDTEATKLGQSLYPELEAYIDCHYVNQKCEEEYQGKCFDDEDIASIIDEIRIQRRGFARADTMRSMRVMPSAQADDCFFEQNEAALSERMRHMSDTFQQYLLYLIEMKGLTNAEVYKRAIITKQLFSKIKLNTNYHPDKATAMRLCIGAKLNLDETKDLLARAGYALSPCDKRDIIFSFFIEHEVFDMIEIDIALEEHGLPCFIE